MNKEDQPMNPTSDKRKAQLVRVRDLLLDDVQRFVYDQHGPVGQVMERGRGRHLRIVLRINQRLGRAGWPHGPWDKEPDRKEWRDTRATPVLPCLIVRQESMGHLCGYVGVPPGHPWYGKMPSASVHGGVTYGEKCQGNICHVAQPGESEPWWVGFDCAHGGDTSPGMIAAGYALRGPFAGVYRTVGYVEAEIRDLVDQARAACRVLP